MTLRPIRLAFVVPQLAPGGAERQLIRTSRVLADAGVDLIIVSTSTLSGAVEAEEGHGLEVQYLERDCPRLERWRELNSTLKTFGPDRLVAWLPSSWFWCEAERLGRRTPELVLAERNSLLNDSRRVAIMKTAVARRATAVVANSRAAAEGWRKRLPRTAVRLASNFPPAGEPVSIRMPGTSKIRFACIGRLQVQKGFDVAIEALAAARKAGMDVSLAIAGSGTQKEEAQLRGVIRRCDVEPHVTFWGQLQSPLSVLREKVDVVLLTSFWEGSSNVLAEALLSGFPIIATTAYETPVDGLQFPRVRPASAPDLTRAIIDRSWCSTRADPQVWTHWVDKARADALSVWLG